ncbi:amidohydrolase family protein [Candidatus Bathyarchaeota archaeon]|nr:amidohydrolase family protein [Candidatus Bathyarchaeota archaeon]
MTKYESILIKHGFLLTMQGEGLGTIEDGAVAIEGEDIVAVGKTGDLAKTYGGADKVIDARGKAVLPGFVDGHIHTGLSLLRGEAQDVPEIEWMLKTMAPFTRHMKPEHSAKGAALGVLEAVKAGTTTFGEIGGDMAPIAEKVFIPAGVRANLANTINEIGPGSRPDANKPYIFYEDVGERKFKEAIELIDGYDGAGDGRITCILSPHGADMMSEELLLRIKEKARELGKLAHIHVAQGGREEIQMRLRYGTTTIKYLDSIGYLDDRLIAAHCHQTTDDEVTLLAKRGVRYASCPSSIGGIDGITPPLALFIQSGGRYATIGSDQAPGNGHHNMLVEMKVAALLNKTRHRDPTVLPAWKMLRLATAEGAATLGIGDRVGSLEPGKKADVILLDLMVPHMTPVLVKPVRNVAPNIVYSARGDEVTDVIINGRMVVEDRTATTMDEQRVIEDAQRAAEEIAYNAADDFMAADGVLAKAVRKGLI